MWPVDEAELERAQDALAAAEPPPWRRGGEPLIGACFVCFGRGVGGRGTRGEPGWAAAALDGWVGGAVAGAGAVARGGGGGPQTGGRAGGGRSRWGSRSPAARRARRTRRAGWRCARGRCSPRR